MVGAEDFKQFYLHISDMLYLINEQCMPREREKVKADDFAMVGTLVEKAMV